MLQFSVISTAEGSGLQKATDFTTETFTGQTITLSDYEGEIIVLNFWTTWCQYCQEEMEELIRFAGAKEPNVHIIAINVTSEESSENAVKHFVNQIKLPFQIGLDKNGAIAQKYQVIGIPTTFIINKRGEISKKIFGPIHADLLFNEIERIN
ncbi:TlpA disulfide reductase family protein [Metabacillus malikii]|uniref:Peroxiredoxin n=1 Tax=Metabacillus malikii TaxID=1504265 RepID=A0ABT9ZB54_9BACI|nr:TlpA disulfide reductase family protein [Metabacillus malikii]MDQ0229495.1 peroxiredoxin [Metabacillus malikii]